MKQLLCQLLNWKKHIQWIMSKSEGLRISTFCLLLMVSAFFATPAFATGVYEMPNFTPNTWVVDQAEVLSRVNEGKISSAFEDLAKQTGNEVRFVTVRRLDYGETPESFTKALFEKWFPTTEAQANQTLLMIDTVTNGAAIISGDRVKSLLTDEIAKSVVDETLMAPLREGDKYNQAFLDASDRLVAVLSGEPDPGPPQIVEKVQVEGTFGKTEAADKGSAIAWVVGLLIAATVIPMATYYIYLAVQPSSSDGQ
ncbi:beta-propeller domain-containing protein, methanol dehydrogenase [Fischerella thermalis CCMEE 5268]|uniref:Beta-propeller domain-containing protein, methanol dehydrogenase n=1 Tax=Fischerella thermalis CCMEE 5268 TaxID=2019662 RepID=A0A2N6KHM9_9CYAN|nr:TPM domain-containing protein [Fischerella thermalis]PLZ98862.1 beta-propeller domain-containing protein, methanol dehydrogenase [Fischerella thermalis CCMEE 5268]